MGNILIDILWGGLAGLLDYLSVHVLTCLIPAFFIAGAIAVFISKGSVLKYFGSDVKGYLSYGIASISGIVLAVCSCTILPLFAGIYRRGAGIGPATTLLFSGPAINVLAIIYTAQVLGYDIGLARAISAILLAMIVGLSMELSFRREPKEKEVDGKDKPKKMMLPTQMEREERPRWVVPTFFLFMVVILLVGASKLDRAYQFPIVYFLTIGVALILIYYFTKDDVTDWGYETWDLAKKIFPVLLIGTFAVGMIAVVLPPETFGPYLGGNSFASCLLASLLGTILYMPTLLEVPIIGTTFGYSSGMMGGGPALSLLLSGPTVSLPSLLVLYRIMGLKKTVVYTIVVLFISALAGYLYGIVLGG